MFWIRCSTDLILSRSLFMERLMDPTSSVVIMGTKPVPRFPCAMLSSAVSMFLTVFLSDFARK